jgi:hypothetical protein
MEDALKKISSDVKAELHAWLVKLSRSGTAT